MLAQYDSFGNFETPQITLCNPDGRALGILSNLSDRRMNIRFNDLSDLSFTIRRGAKACRCPAYEQVEPFRYLLLEGIGYFVITDVSESEEENDAYKTVEASSCEYELNNVQLDYYEGVYGFYNAAPQDEKGSLMTRIMEKLPSWRLDTRSMPGSVASRFRTFDTTDQTVYSFLMTELEEAYECIFEFDILERVIRVFDRYSYDNRTDICLSTEDVLRGLTLRTKSDEIKTALCVKGGNGLDILSVNPLGANMIYDFSYYATPEWMDTALIARVKQWQADVRAFAGEGGAFPLKRAEIDAIQARKSNKEGEITRLKQEVSNLQTQQSAIISEPAEQAQKNANLAAIRAKINEAKAALKTAEGELAAIEAELTAANAGLKALQQQIALNAVFSPAEMEVLSRFIQQGAYTEENITRQDDMDYAKVQAQALELYNKAQGLLQTISTPRFEYAVETDSFVFQQEFAHLARQLNSGCLIDIRLAENDVASLLLLEMAVDYDGRGLSLTFGNRYKLSDPSALFNDLIGGSVAKTASTVEYLRSSFDFKQQHDELDALKQLKDESINLTHNMVVNADNQVMVIDASGISGRRAVVDADFNPTGEFDPEVLKITNNAIAFSTDDFQTTETVLGKNLLPDGVTTPDGKNYMYGLNAKLLMGDLIIGESLKVSGEIEGRLINAKGLTVNNGATDTLRVDENGDVTLNVKSLSISGNQAATQGDVTNGLNGMQIGGRNHLLNSNNIFTNQSREFFQTHDLAPVFNMYGLGAWTLSFDLKCTKNHWVKVYCQNGNDFRYDIGNHVIQATANYKRFSVTFTPYVYMPQVAKSMLAFFSEYDSGAFVTVKNLKLEKGTKATDWTPAPEDRAYLVSTLSPTQADGMWLGSDGKLNITATQIKAGRLQAKNGSSYFDLESGQIVGKNSKMAGRFVSPGTAVSATLGNTEQIDSSADPGQMLVFHPKNLDPFSGFNIFDSYGYIFVDGTEGNLDVRAIKKDLLLSSFQGNVKVRASDTIVISNGGIARGELHINRSSSNETISELIAYPSDTQGYAIGVRSATGAYFGRKYQNRWTLCKLYHANNMQCGEAMVPNGSLSGGIYTGEVTIYFSPAFSKAPRITVTARTGGPRTCQASLGAPPTANSFKIIVQRNSKTADGYTAVQWIAIEPR